jgi:hypothetical protein
MKEKINGCRTLLVILGAALFPGSVLSNDEDVQPATAGKESATHMSEELRASVSKIVILASAGASSENVTGSYNKETPGLLGGMADGSQIGTIPVEVGPVPVGIPIPILREIGMIFGAISGGAKAEIQEFRDKMTDDLGQRRVLGFEKRIDPGTENLRLDDAGARRYRGDPVRQPYGSRYQRPGR